jgi:phosphonate transport system permease protein
VVARILAWSWRGAEIDPVDLFRDAGNMLVLARDFMPPDFEHLRLYMREMVTTLHIAFWGTLLAVVCSVPLGLMCSENVAPLWLRQPVRRAMDALRAINEMVFAMLFVVCVGLGAFAGVLALWAHTTGILAKLFSEAVEAIDPQPVEGIRSTGASVIAEILYGVVPQVFPLWISFTLYRFESNVRSATVLGMVGAGGIGVILWEVLRGFQFRHTCACMLVIIVAVTLIDMASQRLRKMVT